MTITEEELQKIVARAVILALGEIVGEREESDAEPKTPQPATNVEVKTFDEDELQNAMNLMESNRGKDDEPKVGIFWYDPRNNELFGVRSHRASDYAKPYSRTEFGSVSRSEEHTSELQSLY